MRKNDFLKQVRVFLCVVRSGSMGRASESLSMAPPQISRTIAALEQSMGRVLLERTSSGIRLTKSGALFAEEIRPLIEKLSSVEHRLLSKSGAEISISMPSTAGSGLFSEWLSRFQNIQKDVSIKTSIYLAPEDALKGLHDLCIVQRKDPPEARLIALRLGSVPLVNVSTANYLTDFGDVLTPGDLATHRLLFCPNESEVPYDLIGQGNTVSVDLSNAVRTDNLLQLRQMVLADGGIGLGVPRWLVVDALRRHELIEVLPEYQPVPETVWLLRTPQRFASFHLKQLVVWLREKWKENVFLG